MSLRCLSVQNLRNLQSIDIEPATRLNIIYGANGSGKTSLLEAINILSLGRSFRSRKHKTMIQYDQPSFTVFGKVESVSDVAGQVSVGVQRERSGDGIIRIDGRNVLSAIELAENLPVLAIDSSAFDLLGGSPSVRRQYLDWLVFHVEPSFLSVWKGIQKCLKHRNSLLRRDKIDPLQLAPWDAELARLAHSIDEMRARVFERLSEAYRGLVGGLEGLSDVALNYHRGWDREQTLEALLAEHQQRDIDLGYTRQGPQRADIRVMVGRHLAADTLSRGQQKIVACALLIAQGLVFSQQTDRQCVYLIDDLPAELDAHFRATLAGWLCDMQAQVFVTGVDQEILLAAWPDKLKTQDCTKMFHVEHGAVKEVELPSIAV